MEIGKTPTTETLVLHERENARPPAVTVIVPLYNYGHFVREALDSVALQTIESLDLIVVDDCSTDDSPLIASRWMEENCKRFRRAMVLRHLTNAGLAATRNTGFGASQTEFVFPLDADNLLYPPCLEKLVQSLHEPHAAFAYCIVERFVTPPAKLQPPFLMHIHPWRPEALPAGNMIDAMVLLRMSVWKQVGGYSMTMPCQGWEDYDLWFKIARIGGYGLHVPQILARYRVHASSMLHTVTNKEKSIELLNAYLRDSYPEFFAQQKAAKPASPATRIDVPVCD